MARSPRAGRRAPMSSRSAGASSRKSARSSSPTAPRVNACSRRSSSIKRVIAPKVDEHHVHLQRERLLRRHLHGHDEERGALWNVRPCVWRRHRLLRQQVREAQRLPAVRRQLLRRVCGCRKGLQRPLWKHRGTGLVSPGLHERRRLVWPRSHRRLRHAPRQRRRRIDEVLLLLSTRRAPRRPPHLAVLRRRKLSQQRRIIGGP